jgi:hypothetical protein
MSRFPGCIFESLVLDKSTKLSETRPHREQEPCDYEFVTRLCDAHAMQAPRAKRDEAPTLQQADEWAAYILSEQTALDPVEWEDE